MQIPAGVWGLSPQGTPPDHRKHSALLPAPHRLDGVHGLPRRGEYPQWQAGGGAATCSSGPGTRTVPIGAGHGLPRRGKDISGPAGRPPRGWRTPSVPCRVRSIPGEVVHAPSPGCGYPVTGPVSMVGTTNGRDPVPGLTLYRWSVPVHLLYSLRVSLCTLPVLATS